MSTEDYSPTKATAAGCLFAFSSALITGFLLLVNGAIVLAMLNQASFKLPNLLRKPQILQFLLFFLPVVLVVIQWIILDTIRSLFRRRQS